MATERSETDGQPTAAAPDAGDERSVTAMVEASDDSAGPVTAGSTTVTPDTGAAGAAVGPVTAGSTTVTPDTGAAGAAVGPRSAGAAQATEEPTGLRVLVAEDEALIRLDLAEMIEEAGYRVVGQAGNGAEAIELARSQSPDVIVMDVKMPVLDGISAAETIGAERLAPVVMLTAFSDRDLVERARDAGVMAYVVKPFTIDDLRPALHIARSRWSELHALEAEVADLSERLETRKAVDRAKGILMSQLGLSEADAFRWIQKTAMDRRLGMRDVAEAVVKGMPKTKK